MEINKIKQGLKANYIGKEIHYFNELTSTNETAKQFANDNPKEGTIIIAERQIQGKGRLNRKWNSPIGGIYFSIILTPEILPSDASKLILLTAVAVVKSLNQYDLKARIKWPNDILIKGKKVSGILNEMSADINNINFIIVGIGINANIDIESLPKELQETSTSIKNEFGKKISRIDLITKILNEFEELYEIFKTGNFTYIISEWKKLTTTLGKKVKVIIKDEVIEGTAFDIDEHGALLIKADGEIKRVISGDCIHLNQ